MTTKIMQHARYRLVEVAGANFKGTAQQQPARLISTLLKGALTVVGSLIAMAALAAEPIEIIVPFGPTSGADTLARYCAPALESALTVHPIDKWINDE